MTADKYERANERDNERNVSLEDIHGAVTSLTGFVRNMSSQLDDIAGTTQEIHDAVTYEHSSPVYGHDPGYENGDDE
jgi:hypothetical protein